MNAGEIQQLAQRVRKNVRQVIVGKDELIDLLIVALFSSGHVLLEDVPGTGKTLMAKSLAKSLNCSFKRIQFTPDLLPSDLSGINFFNQRDSEFQFRPGPLFCNILLADEINRATPRTQSSLLECMEERQITIDGETRTLEQPFLVLATQNPVENQGTFPLPEAQLDRFLLKLGMGYPSADEGVRILERFLSDNPFESLEAVAGLEEIRRAQSAYKQVRASGDVLKYILDIVEKTRNHSEVLLGASPRGSQALLRAAQVHALLQGRDYILPDDIKHLAKPVLAHRLVLRTVTRTADRNAATVIDHILSEVLVPAEVLS